VHTRVFSFFFLFLFLSLSLSLSFSALFFRFFSDRRPLLPFQALSRPFSLPLIPFCVTRTLHRRSSVLERSTLYTAMFSRKSNPFSARPTNGRSRSRCIRQCVHRLFRYSSFDRFKISFVSLYAFSREQSLRATSGTFAQMFSRTRESALCFVRLPPLAS